MIFESHPHEPWIEWTRVGPPLTGWEIAGIVLAAIALTFLISWVACGRWSGP